MFVDAACCVEVHSQALLLKMDGRMSLPVGKIFLMFAIVIFACSGIAPVLSLNQWRNPGLIVQYSETYFDVLHQDIILGTELQKKLKQGLMLEFADKITTVFWSTMRFSLTGVTPKSYETPRTKTSISRKDGISTVVSIGNITFEGNYVVDYYSGLWLQYNRNGTISIYVEGISLIVTREIVLLENTDKMKFVSSKCSASIGHIDAKLHDPILKSLIAIVNLKQQLTSLEKRVCRFSRYFLDTEISLCQRINLGKDIHVNMSLLRRPIFHDGYVQFEHIGELSYRGNNRIFPLLPRQMVLPAPKNTIVYGLSDHLFNSLGYLVHNHQLLSYMYTKSDLPHNRQLLLSTSCEKECFGKLFPTVSTLSPPNSSVEISVSIAEPPNVQITQSLFTVFFDFNIRANVRLTSDSAPLLFSIRLLLSAPVTLDVKKHSLRFELHQPHTNITVIESRIGELSKEALYMLIEQSFQKVVVPFYVQSKLYGLKLHMREELSVGEYKRNLHNGYATLSVDLLNMNAESMFVTLTNKNKKPRFWGFILTSVVSLTSKELVKKSMH